MKIQTFGKLLLGALGAAAFGQSVVPPADQPVSGSCIVSLLAGAYKRETCELSTENGAVPNGSILVIEHVSSACSTAPGRGIFTLALIARLSPENRSIRTTHIPVMAQARSLDSVRMIGAQNVRIYAGPTTSVDVLLSTQEGAPAGQTGCEVNFSGVLRPVNG